MSTVLVAYASKHRATAEIAEAIADELRAHGHTVECAQAAAATVNGYDAVVLGSGVYMGRWLGDARAFLKDHHDALAARPLWLFSSGPVGEQAAQLATDPTAGEPAKIGRAAQDLAARGHIVFGGAVPDDPSGLVEKAVVHSVPAADHDARDWTVIRDWASGIAAELASAAS